MLDLKSPPLQINTLTVSARSALKVNVVYEAARLRRNRNREKAKL